MVIMFTFVLIIVVFFPSLPFPSLLLLRYGTALTEVTKGNLRRKGLPIPEEDVAPAHRPATPHVRFNGEDLWDVLTNNKVRILDPLGLVPTHPMYIHTTHIEHNMLL